jgi:hypothetical protein
MMPHYILKLIYDDGIILIKSEYIIIEENKNTHRRCIMKKLVLAVAVDDENNNYSVDIPAGSNVAETAFAMSVVIKCLVRDNVIDDHKIMTDMIDKYLTDSQYEEVRE